MDNEKKHNTIQKETLKQVFSNMMQDSANQNQKRGGSLASIVHDWQTKMRIDYIFGNADAGSQKPKPEQHDINTILATIPETKRTSVLRLLDRLKTDGWITRTATGYKWKEGTTLQVIAFWVEHVSLNLKLSNRFVGKTPAIKWKPFEALFDDVQKEGQLKNAKQSWLKIYNTFYPNGFEQIEPYTK